ncbi:MAG: aminopeptidase P family N-terminal domain-containing protein, partial [Blastococcus sp.]
MIAPASTPAFAGFSAAEMRRRRDALEAELERAGVDHAVLYGANRSGAAVSWLTGWPVTREAHVLVTRGEPDVLLVSFFNHVPEARRRAADADVRFAGDRPAATVVELLRERGAGSAPVGLVGPLPWNQYAALAEGRRVVDLSGAHTRLRLRKSGEEVAALRAAAGLTDAAALALVTGPVVDLSGAHTRLRLIKSGEEIAALRHAAALTDAAASALVDGAV